MCGSGEGSCAANGSGGTSRVPAAYLPGAPDRIPVAYLDGLSGRDKLMEDIWNSRPHC